MRNIRGSIYVFPVINLGRCLKILQIIGQLGLTTRLRTMDFSMTKTTRIILFIITFFPLLFIPYLWQGTIILTQTMPVLLWSALVVMAYTSFFIEHYFTKPTNVLVSTLTILLMLLPLREQLLEWGAWYNFFLSYNFVCLVPALLSLSLANQNDSQDSWKNKIAFWCKEFSTYFGNGKFLYSALFVLTLIFYKELSVEWLIALLLYVSYLLVVIESGKSIQDTIIRIFNLKVGNQGDIGTIFGVQSKNIFLVQLYEERDRVKRFDFVEFQYAAEQGNRLYFGLIIDNYLLNQQQWIKVLITPEMQRLFSPYATRTNHKRLVVYKFQPNEQPDFLNRFAGVIMEGSEIGKIKFEYGFRIPVTEGSLLEVSMQDGKKVLYQVVQGITDVETLESKNEAGLIVGGAIQLGCWNGDIQRFEKYGWVPEINTPVYQASDVPTIEPREGEFKVGEVPNTNFPVIINKKEAVTHHLAVLGVTGSGKSVFSRNLIREIIGDGMKVICVDFTQEYAGRFRDLNPDPVVNDTISANMFDKIETLSSESSKFKNLQNATTIANCEKALSDGFENSLETFFKSKKLLTIFELPDLSNTSASFIYTRWFFNTLFKMVREDKNLNKEICVVLEEAHTVIPEWNFIGDSNAGSLVNAIGQIALQARKYNIGFIVIAQRTANVSKTVLTQCNSIIAFQQFDQTSKDFLSNYMGTDMANALPNLKTRQAIAVGKGFKGGIPIIFQVPEIEEPEPTSSSDEDDIFGSLLD